MSEQHTTDDALPELTDKERAALDRMTPDFISRLIESGGEHCDENEMQEIDEYAKYVAENYPTSDKQEVKFARRLVGLLASFAKQRKAGAAYALRAIRAEAKLAQQPVAPEPGESRLCMVCATQSPWGVWDASTGATVCASCRDKSRNSQMTVAIAMKARVIGLLQGLNDSHFDGTVADVRDFIDEALSDVAMQTDEAEVSTTPALAGVPTERVAGVATEALAAVAECERLRKALEESLALNINYHETAEDGQDFEEAKAVIKMAKEALQHQHAKE